MEDSRTFERGRFYIGPNGFPRFAGSASGIYLADTISTEVPSGSEIGEAFVSRNNGVLPIPPSHPFEVAPYDAFLLKSTDLRRHDELRARLNRYFLKWHPLFPFLDGAYVLQCFDNAVALSELEAMMPATLSSEGHNRSAPQGGQHAFQGLKMDDALVLTTVFTSVFSIGDLDERSVSGTVDLAGGPRSLPLFRSTKQVTTLANLIVGCCQDSSVNDLFALQALASLELWLYVTRSFRPAMHLSGTVAKLAYEAGLHRCPERYPQTFRTAPDRDLRKRVFYSLYVLDRLLSAEFGIPIMLSDTDIDTCPPGDRERHLPGESYNHPTQKPAAVVVPETATATALDPDVSTPDSSGRKRKRNEVETMSPAMSESCRPSSTGDQAPRGEAPPSTVSRLAPNGQPGYVDPAAHRLLPARSLVRMARMIGQAMEIFNKLAFRRSLDSQDSLGLRTSVESWWNDIGLDWHDEDEREGGKPSSDPRHRFATLFTCLYHQQIINLNRPRLSLSPSNAQHAFALQSSIGSARAIVSTLSRSLTAKADDLIWPGYPDMVFFAALILVYSAKREASDPAGQPSTSRLPRDLKRALRLLEHFDQRWNGLKPFMKVIRSFISEKETDQAGGLDSSRIANQSAAPGDPVGSSAVDMSSAGDDAIAALFPGLNDFGDFAFDFSSFELNPDVMWAYHMSLPGSPAL